MSNIFCCKNCERREVGCHARCEDYKLAKGEHNQKLAKEAQNRAEYYQGMEIDIHRLRRHSTTRFKKRW